jgi:hypothetical protein
MMRNEKSVAPVGKACLRSPMTTGLRRFGYLALSILLGAAAGTPALEQSAEAQAVRPPRPTIVRPQKPERQPPPTRPPRPTRVPRPTRTPRGYVEPTPTNTTVVVPPTPTPVTTPGQVAPTATATATAAPVGPQSCPGIPVPCPAQPACRTGNKIGQLYYKHPVAAPIITNKVGEFRLNPVSNGIHPGVERGSFSLVDKDDQVVALMTDLEWVPDGTGWRAENADGWVKVWPSPAERGYFFQVQYNTPNFPPGYFSVVFQMCLNIGDDGVHEQIVCQPKARDAWLCHNNGPTFNGYYF